MTDTPNTKSVEVKEPTLMTEEESERVVRVLSIQDEMKRARDIELDRWEDNIKRQQIESDDGSNELGRTNLRIGMEFAWVESKTADEVETLPFPIVKPISVEDNEDAKLFQAVVDYEMNDVLNYKRVLAEAFLKQKNTLGDAIIKVYWNKEFRQIRKPKKTKSGKIKYTKKTIVAYNDIKYDIIDLRNFVIDPIVYQAGKTLEDANYCGFYSYYSYEAFKKLFGMREGYKNLDLVQPSDMSNDQTKSSEEQNAVPIEGDVEVYEHWDILNDELVTIASGIEIRETACPYHNPFTEKKTLPIAHFVGHLKATGFFNFGEIDLIKDLAEEREAQRNINLDAAKGYTHPWLAVGGMNDFDSDEFILGINHVMELDDINQIKQFNMAGNTGLPFNLEQANQQDAIVVTGHDITGVLSTTGQTATQTLEKKEAAQKRTKFGNFYNEVNGFLRLYTLTKNLILQYFPAEKMGSILGKDELGQDLYIDLKENKEMFDKDYILAVVANNQIPASKEIRKLRNQEALQTLAGLPFNQETGQLPAYLIPATKKVMEENLQLSEAEIDAVLNQEEPQGNELDLAMTNASEAGIPIEGGPTGGFKKGGAAQAEASQQPGLQEGLQTDIQNIIS